MEHGTCWEAGEWQAWVGGILSEQVYRACRPDLSDLLIRQIGPFLVAADDVVVSDIGQGSGLLGSRRISSSTSVLLVFRSG